MERRVAPHSRPVQGLALFPWFRSAARDTLGFLIDRLGGWPVELPDGTSTRVAFRSRDFARGYEAPVMARFIRELGPEMTVVDVGAHWGLYTLVAAEHVDRVIAFEPVAANRQLLERNVALARLKNVDVRSEAITDQIGRVAFYAYEGSSWGLSMMGGLLRNDAMRPVDVPTTTVDALRLRPDLMKIDVEGAEAAVIRGATETLSNRRPRIFLEVHRERLRALGSSPDLLRSSLVDLGYEIEPLWQHGAPEGEQIEHWLCLGR